MRVLIVEDERKLVRVLSSALQAEHYDVVAAPSGDDGFFRANAEAFDLVVLDLMLPGRSGLDILQALRQRRIHTPVLILTARDGVVAQVDRLLIREAIVNVLDNAVKYSPSGSTITVRVDAADHDARISVADEGPGIAAQHRERIFDRFYRIDEARSREHGGAGLGLAIAKWAVDVNGGHIAVEAGTNGGSVFRIVLPLGIAPNASSSGPTTQHMEERT